MNQKTVIVTLTNGQVKIVQISDRCWLRDLHTHLAVTLNVQNNQLSKIEIKVNR